FAGNIRLHMGCQKIERLVQSRNLYAHMKHRLVGETIETGAGILSEHFHIMFDDGILAENIEPAVGQDAAWLPARHSDVRRIDPAAQSRRLRPVVAARTLANMRI